MSHDGGASPLNWQEGQTLVHCSLLNCALQILRFLRFEGKAVPWPSTDSLKAQMMVAFFSDKVFLNGGTYIVLDISP